MAKLNAQFLDNIFEQETPTGLINGSNTAFTLSSTPQFNKSLMVFLDGLFQLQGVHYTISGTTITMTFAPATNQDLSVFYIKRA